MEVEVEWGGALTADATVMLPAPGGEDALAVIALLGILVVHPVVSRET